MKIISQQGKKRYFDVLVIGSGIAGLSYILELLALAPKTKIALISKKSLIDSNSFYAQGGMAAAQNNAEMIARHVVDTLAAGDGLSSPQVAEKIIRRGAQAIEKLTDYGVKFNPNHLGQEGGHSERRIYYVGDYSGQAIIEVLIEQVKRHDNVTIFDHHNAVNLITDTSSSHCDDNKEVLGAYILNQQSEKIDAFVASAVILATGGAGKIYQYTSNPDTATGDGIAMAYRAGAAVSNMEFYQFHPTLLYHQKLKNFLISEAMRGENAYLRRPGSLERFMKDYAPQQMEMATRDIVARAIFNEIDNSEYPYVYLDVRHQDPQFIQQRFPNIYQTLNAIGIDITKDLIPVVPAAHYLCGGIVANAKGQTKLKRLYAIGETACTGLHGANRLASNSLLEGAVTAYYTAEASLKDISQTIVKTISFDNIDNWDSQMAQPTRRRSEVDAHWRGLRSEMTFYAGIIRHANDLKKLLKLIDARKEMIESHYWQHVITADLIEARNVLLIAELIVKSALNRQESRGGHYRSDYPQKLKDARESIEKK